METHYNRLIDFTLLKDNTTEEQVEEICKTAINKNYFGVCIYPCYVTKASSLFYDEDIKIVTVIDFPEGRGGLGNKTSQVRQALDDGAEEIDMVMNYHALKEGKTDTVLEEIETITSLTHGACGITKVIIESGILDMGEVEKACDLCQQAGADFVKTSTGKVSVGAELDKVRHMRAILPSNMKIKASGGIKTLEDVKAFHRAGADRIGTSSAI